MCWRGHNLGEKRKKTRVTEKLSFHSTVKWPSGFFYVISTDILYFVWGVCLHLLLHIRSAHLEILVFSMGGAY